MEVNKISFKGWVTPMRDLLQKAYELEYYGQAPKAMKLVKRIGINSDPWISLSYNANELSAKIDKVLEKKTKSSFDSFILSSAEIEEKGFLDSLENLANYVTRQNRKIRRILKKGDAKNMTYEEGAKLEGIKQGVL